MRINSKIRSDSPEFWQNFYEDPIGSFIGEVALTDKQTNRQTWTDRQTDRRRENHNLLDGGNKSHCGHQFRTVKSGNTAQSRQEEGDIISLS